MTKFYLAIILVFVLAFNEFIGYRDYLSELVRFNEFNDYRDYLSQFACFYSTLNNNNKSIVEENRKTAVGGFKEIHEVNNKEKPLSIQVNGLNFSKLNNIF